MERIDDAFNTNMRISERYDLLKIKYNKIVDKINKKDQELNNYMIKYK